ncbi:MAG: glycosyl hydrolase, partial [Desulfobacteraceae bacterium]
NVPVLFRPFHEAEGNDNTDGSGAWFWWGAGGAEVYKELWKLLYTTLTEKYGIHNAIWEVNLYLNANSLEWYPGDNYVDIVAYDKYEGSPYTWGTSAATTAFLKLVNYTNDTKMVAMTENDIIPDIQNIVNEGAWWLYFCPWYGDFILSSDNNDPALLNTIYNSEYVISLDELPEDLYGYAPTDTLTDTQTETDTTTETITETDTETVTETDTETVTETDTETVTETDTETITETDTETITETDTETITETDTETITETDTETVTETDTETVTETDTDTGGGCGWQPQQPQQPQWGGCG